MIELINDALTNKTYLHCEYNNIQYDIKHRNAIKQVDELLINPPLAIRSQLVVYTTKYNITITRADVNGI